MDDFSSGGFDWNDALAGPDAWSNLSGLGDMFQSAGYQGDPYSNSPLMTGGGENSEATIDPRVTDWMKQNGMTLGTRGGVNGMDYSLAGLFNKDGQQVGKQQGWSNDAGPLWSLATNLAAGAATGGLGAGMGLTGAAAAGASGAAGGALSAGMQGGNILKGALTGGVGGGLGSMNPAGMMGVDNPLVAGATNKAVTGATGAFMNGSNPFQGALKGVGSSLLPMGANYASSQLGDKMDAYGSGNGGFDGLGDMPEQPGLGDLFGRATNQSRMPQDQINAMNDSGINQAMNPNMSMGTNFNPSFGPSQQGSNPIKEMMKGIMGVGSNFDSGGNAGRGVGNLVGGLAGLYSGYMQRKRMGGLAGQLQDMYSPNSAYAQQMRQQLDRRDAAAGRRSQYGPREVELQANLANMNSRNAPTLANLYGGENQGTERMLSNVIRMGQQSGAFGKMQDWMNSGD